MRAPHLCALLALAAPAAADLRLAPLLQEHAVLQRETTVPVRGWTAPGAEVTVTADWSAEPRSARADARGAFSVPLRTPEAGGPYALIVSAGGEELRLADVLVGDVWIASGQSNMQWPLFQAAGGEEAAAAASDARLRLFTVEPAFAAAEEQECAGAWAPCAPAAARDFSAVGFFFGSALAAELDVPVGIVDSSFGGTVAEAWISAHALRAQFPEFADDLERMSALAAGDEAQPLPASGSPWLNQNRPAALWNAMVAPLAGTPIRGVIWYQGESNRERHAQYRRLFPALIADWRKRFGQGDFPFYFVQLAPFDYPGDAGELALLREAQAEAQLVPYTGMAVTMDVGDPADIHPRDKRTVGERLAALALAGTYGRAVPCRGPTFRSLSVEGGAARLLFDGAEGLTSRGAPPASFELAGADRVFHPAEARIEGEAILLASPEVPEPAAVRFAWRAADASNVWNGAGLPLSSFRTDRWP